MAIQISEIDHSRLLGIRILPDPRTDRWLISAKIGIFVATATPEMVEERSVFAQASASTLSAQALVTNRILTLVSGRIYNAPEFRVDQYLWANLSYGEGDVDGDTNSVGYEYDQAAVTFGSDIFRSASGLNKFGVFASLSEVDSELDGSSSTDSELSAYSGGVYLGAHFTEALSLDVVASAGIADLDTSRDTGDGVASGDTDGTLYSGAAKLAYAFDPFDELDLLVSPFLSVEGQVVDLDGFTESDTDDNGTIGSETESRLASVVGVESSKRFRIDQVNAAASLRLGWLHQYQDKSSSSSLVLASDPAVTLTPESPEIARDAVRYGLGVDLFGDARGFAGYADFEGTYNSDAHDYLATVGFSLKW